MAREIRVAHRLLRSREELSGTPIASIPSNVVWPALVATHEANASHPSQPISGQARRVGCGATTTFPPGIGRCTVEKGA